MTDWTLYLQVAIAILNAILNLLIKRDTRVIRDNQRSSADPSDESTSEPRPSQARPVTAARAACAAQSATSDDPAHELDDALIRVRKLDDDR